MHDLRVRAVARRRVAAGESTVAVARDLGVSQAAVYRWSRRSFASDYRTARCLVCEDVAPAIDCAAAYAYLLGQYLGDGHLVTSARIPVLRMYCCTDYPRIEKEVQEAIVRVRGVAPGRLRAAGTDRMIKLQSYWMHWPCLFPQHGPGHKHERPIVLTDWQQALVAEHPWPLIRGLIHSDGCRAMNNVTVRGKRYGYPRYFFANESADILHIMGEALDRVGVAWRYNRPNSISIAKRAAVAKMDAFVGPKR